MKRIVIALALVSSVSGSPAFADALRVAATGCRTPGDAEHIAALQAKKDKAGVEALAGPLVASGACIALPKSVTVDIDERQKALACVRLTGDLSCYWLAAALVDEHPGEKGAKGGGSGHSRHH